MKKRIGLISSIILSAALLVGCTSEEEKQRDTYLKQANDFYLQQDYVQALTYFAQAESISPLDTDDRSHQNYKAAVQRLVEGNAAIGDKHFYSFEYEEAIPYYETALIGFNSSFALNEELKKSINDKLLESKTKFEEQKTFTDYYHAAYDIMNDMDTYNIQVGKILDEYRKGNIDYEELELNMNSITNDYSQLNKKIKELSRKNYKSEFNKIQIALEYNYEELNEIFFSVFEMDGVEKTKVNSSVSYIKRNLTKNKTENSNILNNFNSDAVSKKLLLISPNDVSAPAETVLTETDK